MTRIKRIMARVHLALLGDKSGATAIEYGLLAAGISVVIIATVFLLGGTLRDEFQNVLDQITGAAAGAGGGGGG